MKTTTNVCVAICASLILFVGAGQLQAQSDIFDNFESYAEGSFLGSQGGWFTNTDISILNDPTSSGGGNWADGIDAPGSSGIWMSQPYDVSQVPAGSTVTFEAEVFLRSTGSNRSHNDQIGFFTGQTAGGYTNGIYWNTNGGATTIQVLNGGVGGTSQVVSEEPSNFDTWIPLSIELNTATGSATYTANGFSVTDTGLDFSALTHVGQTMDLRSGAAGIAEFNVYVPEPSTVMLAGVGLLGIALGWRRRRQR